MPIEHDNSRPWLHGSPEELSELRVGSMITQDERLAMVFSHKPTLVSVDDDGSIHHNGRQAGILYRVAEIVQEADLVPVPNSTLGEGTEWLIVRPMIVVAIARVPVNPDELLTPDQEDELRHRMVQPGA